ncbi:ABC transporter ATP-binding protein [Thalassobaculum sp.]|uniref:ABC transporter ATP-binding protein n=1 Tax=Thalassobaculum sp. TaxID=2022740 RepID=UPI0032ED37C5
MQQQVSEESVLIGSDRSSKSMPLMIEAIDVSKVFGGGDSMITALDAVSIGIREGEFFTLLGPSGCGKTTLLRMIAGFEHPSSGAILLDGSDISQLPPYRRPVNTVFQSYALFPHLTVAQNIAFGLQMLDRPKAEISETVDRMLSMVKMEAMKDRLTSQISGGQQQRVALARALAPQPKVLLLDEPLSALDLKLRKEMQIELKRLQHETGITFVFVTHDQEEALTMSDRIAVMSEGHVLQVGSPHDIYERPANRFVAGFIGETNTLTAEVRSATADRVGLRLGKRLELDAELPAGMTPQETVTLVVRPEHVRLTSDTSGSSLPGSISNVVYLGTDTHYHVRLDSGDELVARVQNGSASDLQFGVGQTVDVAFAPSAVRVLRD